jgi:hypothetical protein
LFDRVLTHHLAITSKLLVPIIAIGWLSLIWAGMSSLCLDASKHWTLTILLCSQATQQCRPLHHYDDFRGGLYHIATRRIGTWM